MCNLKYIYKYQLISLINDHLLTHTLPCAVRGAVLGSFVSLACLLSRRRPYMLN